MMDHNSLDKPRIYQITFHGKLDDNWQNWFANFHFSSKLDCGGNALTTLTGAVVDQSALRGMLNKLWNLNLTVITITQIDATASVLDNKDEAGR